jgi:hypothetical protein
MKPRAIRRTPFLALAALVLPLGCDVAVTFVGANLTAVPGDAGADAGPDGDAGMGDADGATVCTAGATQPCYDGPVGTQGQGICQAGMQTCAVDGMSWGACAGQVLPQVENCATPQDEDCDGLAPACQGALLWAERFGDGAPQLGQRVAVDNAGNILIVGRTSGAVDLGGGPILPNSLFMAKLDADGHHVWSKGFQNSAGTCRSVAVDSSGNVFATGFFYDSIDFGGGPFSAAGNGVPAMFVVKLDGNGNHLWSKPYGESSYPPTPGDTGYGPSLAVDSAGDVLLSGFFFSAVDLGGGSLPSAGGSDLFLAKLSGLDGGHVWSQRFGDGGDQYSVRVAVDGMDNVVVAGGFAGAMDFGGGSLPSAGTSDMFVAKLGPGGNYLWSTRWGSAGATIGAEDLAIGGGGEVLVTGFLAGSVAVGSATLKSKGARDVFAAKLDMDGNYSWSQSFGASGGTAVHTTLAVDGGGNVVLTGGVNGFADFGAGQIGGAGGEDAFVAKVGPGGGYAWAKSFGDMQSQYGSGIATDAAGNLLVVGSLSGSANFGSGLLTSAGGADIFVAKFSQ